MVLAHLLFSYTNNLVSFVSNPQPNRRRSSGSHSSFTPIPPKSSTLNLRILWPWFNASPASLPPPLPLRRTIPTEIIILTTMILPRFSPTTTTTTIILRFSADILPIRRRFCRVLCLLLSWSFSKASLNFNHRLQIVVLGKFKIYFFFSFFCLFCS